MAFSKQRPKTIIVGDRAISIDRTPYLDKLENKLKMIAAALGRKKGDIVAEALDEYLTKKWAEVIKSYNEDKDNA